MGKILRIHKVHGLEYKQYWKSQNILTRLFSCSKPQAYAVEFWIKCSVVLSKRFWHKCCSKLKQVFQLLLCSKPCNAHFELRISTEFNQIQINMHLIIPFSAWLQFSRRIPNISINDLSIPRHKLHTFQDTQWWIFSWG